MQSNNFSSGSWPIVNATITGGQTGYDGSSDAWLLSANTAYANVLQTISKTGVLTFSCYAKAGTSDWMMLRLNGSSNNLIYFDVANGVLGTIVSSNYIDSNIEALANGWFRLSITINQTSYSGCNIYVAAADNDLITTNETIYIQDAQLEQGLVARDYQETTTSAVEGGITDNVPRLDYTDSSCPALLLEPQRSNLVPFSEHLESSDWAKTRCTIEDNSTTSPEGVMNASKMTSTDASESYIQDNLATTGTKITWSFFAKKGDLDYAHGLVWDLSANGCRQWFNLSTGAVGGTTTFGSGYSVDSATIEDYGNGWYRCAMVVNSTAGTQGCRVNISSADTTIGSAVNSYGYFYGIQLEDASYATSYIPTYGSAVTRNADFESDNDLVDTAISFGANDDFTLFYEGSFNDLSSTSNMIMGGGRQQLGASYKNYWWVQNATSMRITGDAEVRLATASMSLSDNTNHKLLVKRSGSVVDFFVDGSKLTTTQNTPNTAFTFRSLGWAYTNSVYKVSGNIKQALVFNQALTDQEAIDLTTL